MADLRILSLLPSTTEIACALGLRGALVGRSHECDYPSDVTALPICTSARLADGSSREIDDRVKDLLHRGLSIYDVDADLLRDLRPNLVLTQSQCDVCAASLDDVERALGDWTGERPHIVSLAPATLADVWDDLVRVGEAAGVTEEAHRVAATLTDRVTEIGERTGSLPAPRVACIEWLDPPMAAGNWVPELVRIAGGNALFGSSGAHSPWLDWDELVAADPDMVVFMPCGFDIERTRAELGDPERAGPDWSSLRAVCEGRSFVVDGNAYFNRPGPRLVESLEILAEVLHPEVFGAGHEGRGWVRGLV